MKAILLLIAGIFLSTNSIEENVLGTQSIKAVCRLELKDGSIHEGILTIINGGIGGYKQNGFYLKGYYPLMKLFSISDFAISLNNQDHRKIYYAKNIGSRYSNISLIDKNEIVIRTEEDKFEKLDKVHFFKFSKLGSTKIKSKYAVKIVDILMFELVKEPSEKWLEIIEIYHEKLRKQAKRHPSNFLIFPNWYHKIMGDEEWKDKVNSKLEIN